MDTQSTRIWAYSKGYIGDSGRPRDLGVWGVHMYPVRPPTRLDRSRN
jgi:hypothetical protein